MVSKFCQINKFHWISDIVYIHEVMISNDLSNQHKYHVNSNKQNLTNMYLTSHFQFISKGGLLP